MTELATYSPPVDSAAFLQEAFSQIEATEPVMRTVSGPHLETFQAHREAIKAKLHAIDPRLDIPHLWNPSYRPPEVAALTKQIEAEQEEQRQGKILSVELWHLKTTWGGTLDAYAREVLPAHATKQLEPGVLDVPPYHIQGEKGEYKDSHMSCSLAAYRMVFEGIAGWVPPELDMVEQLKTRYNTVAVPDEVYLKLLSTTAFREATGKQIVTLAMPGTDFTHINTWASKFKNAKSAPQVFAVADIGARDTESEILMDFVTHRVVLQETDANDVVFHDPRRRLGKNRHMPRAEFIRRWASTHNMARLIIARDA